jgi:hypothetical protein
MPVAVSSSSHASEVLESVVSSQHELAPRLAAARRNTREDVDVTASVRGRFVVCVEADLIGPTRGKLPTCHLAASQAIEGVRRRDSIRLLPRRP